MLSLRQYTILKLYGFILASVGLITLTFPAITFGFTLAKLWGTNIPLLLPPLLTYLGGMAFASEAENTALSLERGMWHNP